MSNYDKNFTPKYRKNITNTRILSLWGKNEEDKAASINIYVSGNKLRIRVYTGLSEDKNKKTPNILLVIKDQQITSFLTILHLLEDLAIRHELDGEKKIITSSFFGYIKTPKMSKAERKEVAKIIVGRSKEGVYFFSVINNTHGKISFPLTIDRDVNIYNVNTKELASDDYISKCFTLSWVKLLRETIINTLILEFTDPDDDDHDHDSGKKQNNGKVDDEIWDDIPY